MTNRVPDILPSLVDWLSSITPHEVSLSIPRPGVVQVRDQSKSILLEVATNGSDRDEFSALFSLLDSIQDAICEEAREQWPVTSAGVMAQPAVDIAQEHVDLGYRSSADWIYLKRFNWPKNASPG